MNISPRRRRRMQREHQLRQNGHTLEYIADKLAVSVATVHDDLRLLETNWTDFARATRHDLLMQQINRVNRRISQLLNSSPLELGNGLTVDEIIRVEALYARNLNAANRELRLLLRELPAEARAGGEIIELELADYPDHELADPQATRKNLKKAESPQPAIPSKTQAIAPQRSAEKKSPENLKSIPGPALDLPRNTGRNKPCPCGSGRKRKRCHPEDSSSPSLKEMSQQPSKSPPLGEMSRSSLPPTRSGDRGGLPALPATDLPPHLEAEALRLTEQYEAAQRTNDQLAQVRTLEKLAGLYGK